MLFSCYKVARIIAFVQCLQADIAPFIIHTENKEEYEGRLDSPARLEQLFRVEHRVLIVVLFSQIIGDCLKHRFISGVMQDIVSSGRASDLRIRVVFFVCFVYLSDAFSKTGYRIFFSIQE